MHIINLLIYIVVSGIILLTCIDINTGILTAKTLDRLVSETELVGRDVPHFDVGSVPSAIETDFPNILYVTNSGGGIENGTISVINIDTTKVSDISVGKLLTETILDLNNDALYVPNSGSNTVSVINRNNYNLIKEIPIESPNDITYHASANKLYVSSTFSHTVTVLNYTDYSILNKITVRGASDLYLNPFNNLLYVLTKSVFGANGTTGSFPSVTIINTTDYNLVKQIPIRGEPSDIYIGSYGPILVASSDLDTSAGFVTIINGTDYSIIEEIRVGNRPEDISIADEYVENQSRPGEFLQSQSFIYVANSGSGTVTVINNTDYSIISQIDVGNEPTDVEIVDRYMENQSQFAHEHGQYVIYVANSGSGTVSVINSTDYSIIDEIVVGERPEILSVDPGSNIVYVINSYAYTGTSGTVTAIYEKTRSVITGISVNVKPLHGGRIVCNDLTAPTNHYFYVDFRAQCAAIPNRGFQFATWEQSLAPNSSRTVSTSVVSDSPWNQFWTGIGLGPKDTSANLTVTQFGNFTANFEKLPPPIPDEYLIPLYGIIVSSIIGWSIPSIIGGIKTRRQERRLYSIQKKIDKLYDDERLDSDDIRPLEGLLSETKDAYSRGKLNNERYANLKTEISVHFEEIFRNKIASQKNSAINHDGIMKKIKEEIVDAYAKGKLIESHYNLLNNMISDYEGNA